MLDVRDLAEFIGSTAEQELIFLDWLVNTEFEDDIVVGYKLDIAKKLGINKTAVYNAHKRLLEKSLIQKIRLNAFKLTLDDWGKSERRERINRLVRSWGG